MGPAIPTTSTTRPGPTAPPGDRPIRWSFVAVVLAPALVLVTVAWTRRWTTDDAFINYRIVDHLLSGHGPVFNAGERVEAYTSPLWLAFLALGDLLIPLPIEYVAIVLSLPLAAAGLITMSIASTRLLDPDRTERHWVPAGTLALVAVPVVWDFTTAGLETGLTLAWIGLLALALSRAADAPGAAPIWVPVVAGAAPLVRPDATIIGGAVLAYVLVDAWRTGGIGRTWRPLLAAAALPLAYQVFRMAYFAALVPTTALAKQAAVPHWREGWAYLVDLVAPYALYVPLAALAVIAVTRARQLPARHTVALALLPAASLVHVAYLVRAGGDYAHGRLLLPPLFALVAPVAMVPLRRSLAMAPIVVVALWAAVCAGTLRVGEARLVEGTIIADGRRSIVGSIDVAHPVTAADQGWARDGERAARLRSNPVTIAEVPLAVEPAEALPTPAAALHGIGVSGYAAGTDVHIVDRLGLADPITARFVVTSRGFIGHEKPIPSPWLAARLTDGDDLDDPAVFGGAGFTRPLYESPDGRLVVDTATARRVLGCDDLRRLREATRDPLTPGRLLSNIRDAPGLTRLQIDPDPNRAADGLC